MRLFLVCFCIILINSKGFGRGGEGMERSLQLWEICTTQLVQCLSMPAHKCADPLCILESLAGVPALPPGRGDLNSHTEVGRFGILSLPDRRVIPLHWWGCLSPGEGKTGWVTVARFRQWACCWLRNGLWQPPCFSPAALSGSDFRAAALTGTCKSYGRMEKRGKREGRSKCNSNSFLRHMHTRSKHFSLMQSCHCPTGKRCVCGWAYLEHPQHFWVDFKRGHAF